MKFEYFRYILPEKERQLNISCISEDDKHKIDATKNIRLSKVEQPPTKKPKLSFKEKKKLRGQNKSRGPFYQRDRSKELCFKAITDSNGANNECSRKDCPFLHNTEEYLKIKVTDIGKTCHNYEESGKCLWGITCRFGSEHVTEKGKNIIDEEKFKIYQDGGPYTINVLSKDLQTSLWKKKYNFSLSEKIIEYNDSLKKTKVKT